MNPTHAMTPLDELKRQLTELDGLIGNGTLKGAQAVQARDALEAQIVAAVLKPPAKAAAPARPSRRLLAGLATFVLLFGVAGYAWLGNRQGLSVSPGSPAAAEGAAAPHELGPAQMQAMAEALAERLKSRPNDAEGWSMLGRSYSVLGRYPESLKAYQHVLELKPKDAQALVDYADVLGMVNGQKLDGEPEKLIQRALQLDPDNAKALSLAGTLAFDRNDAAGAARLWERALKNTEPGSPMAGRLQSAVAEARERAGLPALPQAAAAPFDAAAAAPANAATANAAGQTGDTKAATGPGTVQVRISLAPALAAKADPQDTVFIFARAVAGPKAPLAIQRRQVKDLPLSITLDDSMAMSPQLKLSSVAQVIIGARISKSGNAMAQSGDLQGLSSAVAVGARDVNLQIAELVP